MISTGAPMPRRSTIAWAASSPVVTADSTVVIPMRLRQKSPAKLRFDSRSEVVLGRQTSVPVSLMNSVASAFVSYRVRSQSMSVDSPHAVRVEVQGFRELDQHRVGVVDWTRAWESVDIRGGDREHGAVSEVRDTLPGLGDVGVGEAIPGLEQADRLGWDLP